MAGKDVETFNINKRKDFSKWYNTIVRVAELVDDRYNLKGFYVFRPWSVITMELMYDIYERELQLTGHKPCYFPLLIPESSYRKEAEHVIGFMPELIFVTEVGKRKKLGQRYALRSTSETAFYQMYELWVRSWKDLPLKLYQRANVFRWETKATKPFIRTREFYWIEAHDVFASREEAEAQVREDLGMSKRVISGVFGIPFIHFKRPEWDKFPGAEYTYACDVVMPDGKVMQQPSTHLLGQKFSKPFNITFTDKDEVKRYGWQTCYGPAISRIYASLIAVHGDNNGLRLPFNLAPVQVIIIPIISKGSEKAVLKYCNDLKGELVKNGLRVVIDDGDKMPGSKYYYWEMKGVPVRFEVGVKEVKNKTVTVYRRDLRTKKVIKRSALKGIRKLGDEITSTLIRQADKEFKDCIVTVNDYSGLKKVIGDRRIARASYCSIGMNGFKCANKIKSDLTAEVRGVRIDVEERPWTKCVACGSKAESVVYIAREY